MALFGVVLALGAAQAAAQVKVTTPKTVDEGGRITISVSAKISVLPGLSAATTLTITPTVAVRTVGSSADTDLSAAEIAAGLTVADNADYDAAVPENLTLAVSPHPTGGTSDPVSRTLTGTITIQTRPDLDAEDEGIQVTYGFTNGDDTNVRAQGSAALALDSASTGAKKITIKDTDDQLFEWKVTEDSPKEDDPFVVTLTADPTPVDRSYVTAISVDKAGYTVGTPSWTFDAAASGTGDDGPMASITITPPNPDGDREMDTITLKAAMGGTNIDRATPLEIEVADIHGLPTADKISAKAYMSDKDGKKDDKNEAMSVMEGAEHPVHVTVTVDRGEKGYPSGEGLEVTVSADGSQALDYRVEPAEIDIASGTGKQSADFMLWALADDDVGMENLMLTLTAKGDKAKDNGPGEVMGMFSIMIEDTTMPLVSVKDDAYDAIKMALGDDPLNPGDEVMLMNDDLFMYDDEMVNVSFGASVEGMGVSASASGEMVTLMAMEPGEAKVTVTATATPMASGLIVTQDRANVAQLTFPVMVELADLMVTLMGPEDMNIAEGMSAMITAEANRAVTEDTMVELIQTGGTASPSDYTVENITIMAGEMTGTTMLMAVEDMTMEDGMETVMIEGRVGAMKTNALSFNLWDAAVPALPIIAQLLLAAFLAIGGYRRYLRR